MFKALGWAVKPKAGDNNIYINNYVLTEVVSLFLIAAIPIFGEMQDPPENIKNLFRIEEKRSLCSHNGMTYELSAHPINQFGSYPGRKAPAGGKQDILDRLHVERCCPRGRG
jgi:hypothetical protein